VLRADLVIGAVLVTGAKAPTLVTARWSPAWRRARSSSTWPSTRAAASRRCAPTSHDAPTYEVDGVIHYCVPNMPGAVSHTSTFALTNTTMKYALAIADQGVVAAVRRDPALALGVNCYDGACTYAAVAQAHGLEYTPLAQALG
jgi:alanine dehydrogenase